MSTFLLVATLGMLVLVLTFVAARLRTTARNATARAGAVEEALEKVRGDAREARRIQGLVLDAMRDGLLLVAPDGSVAFANDALSRYLGPLPRSVDSLLPLAVREAALGARETGEARSIQVETGAPSRFLRAVATPAADGHTLVVVRDVTEQRRLEAVRRDFVENASHELKTPASTIQATAETLRTAAAEDPEAVPRFTVVLEREAERLSRLVADLLDLSRLESGESLDELVPLAGIAREEYQRLEGSARDAGVSMELRSEEVPSVRGSSRDLSLLVRNLVDNAIRYSAEGDTVIVELLPEDGEVVLRVRDTGIGIPSRDLERVFERFYRVDRARSRETGGTGLGLAIVKHVAENHGGRVAVESELGRGSTFELRLPTADAAPPA